MDAGFSVRPAGRTQPLVGVATAVIGVVLLAAGKKSLEGVNLAPERSLAQLRKDGQLVKDQTQ